MPSCCSLSLDQTALCFSTMCLTSNLDMLSISTRVNSPTFPLSLYQEKYGLWNNIMFIIQSLKVTLFCVLSDIQKANVASLALHLTCLLYIFKLHVRASKTDAQNDFLSLWKYSSLSTTVASLVTGLFFFFCCLNSVAHWPINLLQDSEEFADTRTHLHKHISTHIRMYTHINNTFWT